MLRAIRSIAIVGMNYRFGVAVGVERVTKLLQLFAEFKVVIDLAVKNDPGRAVLVMYWLLTALDIDYRQPAHSQPYSAIDVETVVIRTSMTYGATHAREQALINRRRVPANYSYNSTHVYKTLCDGQRQIKPAGKS